VKAALLDLLYPRGCAVCGARISDPGRLPFCAGCDGALEALSLESPFPSSR